MKLEAPIVEPSLWPLDGPVEDLFVAGGRFGRWQREAAPEDEVVMTGNAWVARDDWALLMATGGPAKLESHAGEILARKGGGEARDGLVVMASEDSFLVRYPWDLLRVNAQLLGALSAGEEMRPGAAVTETEDGLLICGEGTRILPGVYVEGTVLIGSDCKIGPNCYLRGSTCIGDGCRVGQAVEVKNSLLGHGASVGHLSYVGDSILGSRVNFGAGTTTSNLRHDGRNHRSMVDGELVDTGRRKFGTVVGDGVHTGINTTIYPGRKLGPGTTTLPGEVVERDKH